MSTKKKTPLTEEQKAAKVAKAEAKAKAKAEKKAVADKAKAEASAAKKAAEEAVTNAPADAELPGDSSGAALPEAPKETPAEEAAADKAIAKLVVGCANDTCYKLEKGICTTKQAECDARIIPKDKKAKGLMSADGVVSGSFHLDEGNLHVILIGEDGPVVDQNYSITGTSVKVAFGE